MPRHGSEKRSTRITIHNAVAELYRDRSQRFRRLRLCLPWYKSTRRQGTRAVDDRTHLTRFERVSPLAFLSTTPARPRTRYDNAINTYEQHIHNTRNTIIHIVCVENNCTRKRNRNNRMRPTTVSNLVRFALQKHAPPALTYFVCLLLAIYICIHTHTRTVRIQANVYYTCRARREGGIILT